ncbi:hypothetical protein J3U66_12440 [Gilliamella sp. B2969]|uniref:hypothetical protein n=1 Tax=Gilliamella sp. B2969 TaxID=2818021 RepID=UPI002269B761|nr:hypothetical protein [Gilliamella sp. B2969]MCX8731188.1 hypothetical protein [Gilliamella sp. B2969]
MITLEEKILMIKGLISELSETQQLNVNNLVNFLREQSSKNLIETSIAISLISCELELNQR